jgi:perosamine synthetase
MRIFRNHGITTDHRQRAQSGGFFYEMVDLGYNYRLTDFQCALGINQLHKLSDWVVKRQQIAAWYDTAFAGLDFIEPLAVHENVKHSYHIYVVRFDLEKLKMSRAEIFAALRAENIGINVHYIPVHLHPYYRQRLGPALGLCPVAEAAYERIITLPIFPQMTEGDVHNVVQACSKLKQS